MAAPPHITHVRRRRTGVARLALGLVALALLAAGAFAASLLTEWSTETVTVVRTQTGQAGERPRNRTVPRPATAQAAARSGASAAELNDEGYRLMGEGDFDEALPLLEAAVARLRGSGSLVEAYASYNLAFTRLRLGACENVRTLLDRSEDVQGFRQEITRLRRDARRACGN